VEVETSPVPEQTVVPAAAAVEAQAPAAPAVVARSTSDQSEVTYVPLAVTIGDGFKFGCGFFLAMVLAVLVAFVVLAALFVLTSLFGLSLPLAR